MTTQPQIDYELVMVLSPETDEDQATAIVERVSNYVTEQGGTVLGQNTWGVRRLAYPINKFHEGNYLLTAFKLDPEHIAELDRTLVANEDVLRHLVAKMDKDQKRPEPVPVPELVPEPVPESEASPATEAEASPATKAEASPATEAEASPATEAEASPATEA